MASWRDRLSEIEAEHVPDFLPCDKTDKSDKSPPNTPFVTSVAFVSASKIPGETREPESPQLREWRTGIARIDRDRPPKGFPTTDWHALHRDAGPFLTTWGAKAHALGWSTLDLFGLHRLTPAANYSAVGLVPLLRGSTVVAMTADSATVQRGTGARLTFRRQPDHPEAVPLWEMAR